MYHISPLTLEEYINNESSREKNINRHKYFLKGFNERFKLNKEELEMLVDHNIIIKYIYIRYLITFISIQTRLKNQLQERIDILEKNDKTKMKMSKSITLCLDMIKSQLQDLIVTIRDNDNIQIIISILLLELNKIIDDTIKDIQ